MIVGCESRSGIVIVPPFREGLQSTARWRDRRERNGGSEGEGNRLGRGRVPGRSYVNGVRIVCEYETSVGEGNESKSKKSKRFALKKERNERE